MPDPTSGPEPTGTELLATLERLIRESERPTIRITEFLELKALITDLWRRVEASEQP